MVLLSQASKLMLKLVFNIAPLIGCHSHQFGIILELILSQRKCFNSSSGSRSFTNDMKTYRLLELNNGLRNAFIRLT